MVVQLCQYNINHGIVHFKLVSYGIYTTFQRAKLFKAKPETCMQTFTAALFIITRKRKQPWCPAGVGGPTDCGLSVPWATTQQQKGGNYWHPNSLDEAHGNGAEWKSQSPEVMGHRMHYVTL